MRLKLKHRVLNAKDRKGWHSFFIEIYDSGTRVYEPLNMVADPKDKGKYRAAMQFCLDVMAKRQVELSSIAAGMKPANEGHRKGDFILYCQRIADKVVNKKSQENWQDAIKSLARCETDGLTFGEIDKAWLSDFQSHLLENYSQNTARTYSTKIRQAIGMAVRDGHIKENPNDLVKQIQEREGEIKYLYFEEIMLLDKTPHRHKGRRVAFLFNCFVPVRPGDLAVLSEANIRPSSDGGFEVYFRQGKKQRIESIPIAQQGMVYLKQARELAKVRLGREPKPHEPIFDIGHKKWYGTMLKTWAKRAYDKHGDELSAEIRTHFSWACQDLSPHWARHTGATMLLNVGADLDAVGEILGHRDRKTTMRYAKIQPRTKRNTIALMPSISTGDDDDDA
ncbi:MAG: site-specific integrase [Chlorobiaceae bacterium]|nr:site-specific integrase [Chlorobiaceae bacterium]